MTIKVCIKGDEARKQLAEGIKTVADMVSATSGPGGRTIAIQQPWGGPKVTKDGVSVAKSIMLKGTVGEGAKMVVQASEKTARDAGDGTTATCTIANYIVEEGLKAVSKGSKTTEIKRGIDKSVEDVVELIKKHSKEVSSTEEIKQVATVSANGDEEIGQFISSAIEQIGKNGVVTVEEGRGLKTELEVVEGLQIDQGYMSPYFMTNPEKQLVEFDNPVLFFYDGKINNLQSMLPLLESIAKTGRPAVFFVDDIEHDALTALVMNHLKGVLKCCVVKAPSFGDIRKFVMEDMAILTGGEFVSTTLGVNLETIDAEVLGSCSKIKINPMETVIIGGNGDKETIKERVEQLTVEIETVDSAYDKEKLRERLAKLTNGVAIIKVGGATEVEVKEKKDRVDDAVCSTRAALEEGILPGGGVSLLRAYAMLKDSRVDMSKDEKLGYDIVMEALSAPMKRIAENVGVSGEVVVNNCLENTNYNYGFDARQNRYGDLFEFGILDATKVVRCSLENGGSVAGTLLTVEGLIIDDESEKQAPQMPYMG